MTELIESMRQSWMDPVTRHAILVHTPIVLGVFAAPFVFALTLLSRRRAIWYRIILGTTLFGTAVVAWQATEAGEAASTIVEARLETDTARAVLERHEAKGERIPLLLAGTSILVLATLAGPRGVKLGVGLAATASILWTAATIVVTAHEGGLLVYRFDAASVASDSGL